VPLSPNLKTDTDSVSETMLSLLVCTSGRWTKSTNPKILKDKNVRTN
jgi:hypothetical protein